MAITNQMNYARFDQYLMEKAKRMISDKSLNKSFRIEKEDALNGKIATEMTEVWLGLKQKNQV